MATLPFLKYSGNGNDFVVLDHPQILLTPELIQKICNRHFGVGADGVLVLSDDKIADGRMQIFNADGSEAEMCANGLRSLVTYLDRKLNHPKDVYNIQTMNALYSVKRRGDFFALEMSELKEKNIYDLSSFVEFKNKFFINTGVPHIVFLSHDVKDIDIKKKGSYYRHHSLFPRGTNVNFVEILDEQKQRVYVRTYERGVEDETLSCGTGLVAAAIALSQWLGWSGEITLETLGGKQKVSVGEKVFYSGEVTFSFQGEFNL